MFDPHKDWPPIGTVVRLKGADRLAMIVGYMAVDGNTRQAWDYAGYPYPEGKQDPEEVFFDRENIDELYQAGFCDAEGMAFLAYISSAEPSYKKDRAARKSQLAVVGARE